MSTVAPFYLSPRFAGGAALAAGVLFWLLLFKTAWLSDDFWILTRQAEQLFAGNGLSWNPHERIQLFTSVFGFFTVAFGRLFTEDYFWVATVRAIIFNTAVLFLLWRLLPQTLKWGVAVLLLAASKTFMEFSWFGLGNNIGHTLLLAMLLCWRQAAAVAANHTENKRTLISLFVIAGAAPLFRHDFILLLWTPVLWLLWDNRRTYPRRTLIGMSAIMLAPIVLWSLFALFYFGFPFPLSAYFKTAANLPRSVFVENGLHYYRFVAVNDTPVLLLIAAALYLLIIKGTQADKALGAAMSLNLFYVLYSGADYMGGRFLTYAYLLSAVIVVARWETLFEGAGGKKRRKTKGKGKGKKNAALSGVFFRRHPLALGIFALLWMLALPHSPLRAAWVYHKSDPQQAGGIADERSVYHRSTRIAAYWAHLRDDEKFYPDHPNVRLAREFIAETDAPVLHLCNMGLTPHFSGRLDIHFFDIHGYSDPLQARLPSLTDRPGHLERLLPHGYLESVADNTAALTDAGLNEYYKRLRRVTQAPLNFSAQRWADIFYINLNLPPAANPSYQGGRLPLLCYPERDPAVLNHLLENPQQYNAAVLNASDFVSHR